MYVLGYIVMLKIIGFKLISNAGVEILTAVVRKSSIFWDITPSQKIELFNRKFVFRSTDFRLTLDFS
jgi:hypothetical protein